MAEDARARSEERALVQRSVEGDAVAFGKLYALYLDAIYKYVFYRAGNRVEAEDLTERVFLKAWEAIGGYEDQGGHFSSWLYRIAHNVVIDYYRTRKEEPLFQSQVPPPVGKEPGPEELYLRSEEAILLQRAISKLSEEQQQVVILRFVEGLTHAQVSEIVGKSEGACRVIQHRALATLSKLLGEVG